MITFQNSDETPITNAKTESTLDTAAPWRGLSWLFEDEIQHSSSWRSTLYLIKKSESQLLDTWTEERGDQMLKSVMTKIKALQEHNNR